MTSSLKKLVVVLSFFILFFAFSASKTNASSPWNTCATPNTLNCCIQDNRGQLAGCSAGDERYRWYSCERPTSVVKSCSDVCFVNNGVKGQCLTACPCGVGPGTSSNQTSCNAPGTAVFPPACIGGIGVGGIVPGVFTGGSGLLGSVISNLTNLKAGFKGWVASAQLTSAAARLTTPAPFPTMFLAPTAIPNTTATGTCKPPFDTATKFTDPTWITDVIGIDQPCATNYLANPLNNTTLVYRECKTNVNPPICYYDCIDRVKGSRIDCYGGKNINFTVFGKNFNYTFGTQNDNPVRTYIKIINNLPSGNNIKLVQQNPVDPTTLMVINSIDNGIIRDVIACVLDRTKCSTVSFSTAFAVFNNDNIIKNNLAAGAAPETNTLALDLTNTRVGCNKNLDIGNITVIVTAIEVDASGTPIPGSALLTQTKAFKCNNSFDGLIEFK